MDIKKIIKIAVIVDTDGNWDAAPVYEGNVEAAFVDANDRLDAYDENIAHKYLIEAEIDASRKIETVSIKGRTIVS